MKITSNKKEVKYVTVESEERTTLDLLRVD